LAIRNLTVSHFLPTVILGGLNRWGKSDIGFPHSGQGYVCSEPLSNGLLSVNLHAKQTFLCPITFFVVLSSKLPHNGSGIAEGGEINEQMLSFAPQLAKPFFCLLTYNF